MSLPPSPIQTSNLRRTNNKLAQTIELLQILQPEKPYVSYDDTKQESSFVRMVSFP